MDEEMADMNGDEDFSWSSEIDFEYEFDACRFFDFTRPESDAEAHQADSWFDSATSYPPSPFIIKLNLGNDIPLEVEKSSSPKVKGRDNANSVSKNTDVDTDIEDSSTEMNAKVMPLESPFQLSNCRASADEISKSLLTAYGLKHQNHSQAILKAKTKFTVKSFKPRSSTLLKPTASHLAKQNKARDIYSSQRGRLQKPLNKIDEQSLQKFPGHENQATKRQKLESGYLRKAAHLKHQTSMLHKITKKIGQVEANSAYSRSKITVPREPDLETAYRAQSRRSKNTYDSSEQARPNVHAFKARPLNRKILQAPSLPLPKKRMPPVPEFQVFHLKTTERALQHQAANVLNTHNRSHAVQCEDTACRRPNSQHPLKEKSLTFNKLKTHAPNKIFPSEEDDDLLQKQEDGLPMKLFSKLSLKSDTGTNAICQSKVHRSVKGSKENAPNSLQPEIWRCAGKLNPCGSEADSRNWMPIHH